jgi:uncharacterized membrane protein
MTTVKGSASGTSLGGWTPRRRFRLKRHEGTARIEAFSDGVFAIAATLLALDIKAPRGAATAAEMMSTLLSQWPTYVSYLMSFAYLGIYWSHHHAVYKVYRRTDHVFIALNILFLMFITLLPSATALLGEYLGVRDERHQLAVKMYVGLNFITACSFSVLWLYATHERRLVDDDLDLGHMRATTLHYLIAPVSYGLALVLTLWSPVASVVLVLFVALFYALPSELLFERHPDSEVGQHHHAG